MCTLFLSGTVQSVSAATAAAAMIQPVAGPSVSEPPLSLVTTDQVGVYMCHLGPYGVIELMITSIMSILHINDNFNFISLGTARRRGKVRHWDATFVGTQPTPMDAFYDERPSTIAQ